MTRVSIVFFFITLGSYGLFAGNVNIDSLKQSLYSQKPDTSVVSILNKLSTAFREKNMLDTSLYYSERALKLSQDLNFITGKAQAELNSALTQNKRSDYVSALSYLSAAEKDFKSVNNKRGVAVCYQNMGINYRDLGKYLEGLKWNYKALAAFESLNDKPSIGKVYNNIGVIFSNQDDKQNALKYYQAALKIKSDLKDKKGIAISYNNLGNVYADLKDTVQSLKCYFKSLALRKELGDYHGESSVLNNIGTVLSEMGEYGQARSYLDQAMRLRLSLKDSIGLASTYLHIGNLFIKQREYAEARRYLQSSMQIAKGRRIKYNLMICYLFYSRLDSCIGDYISSLNHYRHYISWRDSLVTEDNKGKSLKVLMQYEFDKKQALVKKEEERVALLHEEELQSQRMKRNFMGGGILLLIAVGGVSFREYLQKKKANDLLAHHHAVIEEKNKEITDSINYARRIQNALLTSEKYISRFHDRNDFFILFHPKDIVSGDFYYSISQNGKLYVAVCDCTGHGVPGAFMSMLNISLLNEAIIEKKLIEEGRILDFTRDKIIRSLNPEGFDQESKDGMDCVLVSIDKVSMKLSYAAANNSFYIVRNNELLVFKPDKMPVGKNHGELSPFATRIFDLMHGDMIYMITDGFPDQFGGEKGKKFKYKQLEEKFLEISALPSEEQRISLERTFLEWKGNHEQTDDVCVLGFRI